MWPSQETSCLNTCILQQCFTCKMLKDCLGISKEHLTMPSTYVAPLISPARILHSDWGGDSANMKSTAAYIIYLGPNAISWSNKK